MPLAEGRSQHPVHEPGRARLARHSREIHRIVYDGRCGHAIEVEELIEAQTEDRDDFGIQFGDAAPREMFDEVIEAALPTKSPGDDLRGERSVALVLEVLATGV